MVLLLTGALRQFLHPLDSGLWSFSDAGCTVGCQVPVLVWWLRAPQPVSARGPHSFVPSRSVLTFINDQ